MLRNALCLSTLVVALAAGLACAAGPPPAKPVPLIFDTDMGNDIDDALALAMIHALESQGECKLLAVTLTKDNAFAAPYVDIVNTFYGRGEIPIGVVKKGPTREDGNYNRKVVEAKDDGQPRYPRRLATGADAPDAVEVLRQTLAAQDDGSVVIAQVGFSTNLARLLDSPADKHSPLTGMELVKKKVRLLSAMAGAFADDLVKKNFAEYNIKIDVPAAKTVFQRWPTPIVASGFEVGRAIEYPATSIENGYGYVKHHPVAEAYRHYMKMPYDRETWDLTSVLYAVRPAGGYFGLSRGGQIGVTDGGQTPFVEVAHGPHRYLTVTPEQIAKVKADFVKLCSRPPEQRTPHAPREGRPHAEREEYKDLKIDADFPGGNIIVESVAGDDVYLKQDPRNTEGFWFYWAFRVRGAAGRTLTFHFTGGNVLGVRGPAVSTDGGVTWDWLGKENMKGTTFAYTAPKESSEVRFCLGIPYMQSNLEQWLKKHCDDKHLRVEEHCKSQKGRTVERLRLGKLDGEPKCRMLVTCRHHCCEMMASWAVEGLMDAVLADSDDGRWFRENVELAVVPFMDKDGVEEGDQGKNRRPHDHNRDYMGEPRYPEVAALKKFAADWSKNKLAVAFDMHCPSIRGGNNEELVFVGNFRPEIWERQQQFAGVLQKVQTGPLVYDPKHNIPHGQGWNNLNEPRSNSAWAGGLPGIRLAGTWELPYANAGGKPVTPDAARAFGRDLAAAVRQYLQ